MQNIPPQNPRPGVPTGIFTDPLRLPLVPVLSPILGSIPATDAGTISKRLKQPMPPLYIAFSATRLHTLA